MISLSDFDGFIFDYGGVLVAHQTPQERSQMATIAGVSPDAFDQHYWGERTDYDRGVIEGPEYWSRVAKAANLSFSADQIASLTEADTVSWMNYDAAMWEWVDDLRKTGKRVAMLSNMPMDLGEALKSRTDRLAAFDHVTLSYELRVVKPDAPIYEQCLEGVGTTANRTLFLDDRLENITGADALGIRGVQFTSRDEVLLRLRP